MTDKELLVLAAKVAGIGIVGLVDSMICQPDHRTGGFVVRNERGGDSCWNPLTDDGDALRLAVKLRMDVEPWIHGDSACSRVLFREVLIDEPHYGDDPERATRRAIVRAAAEIGRNME